MAADDPLVAELAEYLLGLDWYPDVSADDFARTTLAWLAAQGRLVPDGAEIDEKWGVRYTCATDGKTDDRLVNARPDAEEWIADHAREAVEAAARGEVWTWSPSLIRRRVITTPWSTEEPADG